MQKALVIRWVYTQQANGDATVPTLVSLVVKVSGGLAVRTYISKRWRPQKQPTGGKYNIEKGKHHGQPAEEEEEEGRGEKNKKNKTITGINK